MISPPSHRNLIFIAACLVCFSFFFLMQYNPTFADPDSFYHTKMALLMKDRGIIYDFPWLGNYTILGHAYTDQHLLYHAFLIPFVAWLHPVVGVKLATAILATAAIMTFVWVLQRWRARFAYVFGFLLMIIPPLIFRLDLPKAPAVSIIFLLLGTYLVVADRWRAMFVLAWLYVWAYGGFSLVAVISGLYVAVNVIGSFIKWLTHQSRNRHGWWPAIWRQKSWLVFFSALAGVGAGLLTSPYFPKNLEFYRYQLFEIGVKNYHQLIGVGGEWYPYEIWDLLSATVFAIIPAVLALAVFVINRKERQRHHILLLLLMLSFLALTLKSRRYVEYFVPFTMLFAATVLGQWLQRVQWRRYWHSFTRLYFRKQILVTLVSIYFLVTVPTIIIQGVLNERTQLAEGTSYTQFAAAGAWLAQHSNQGDIVLHSDWDEFPALFYYDDVNNYINGLDSTFMYLYDKDLHKKWVDITMGNQIPGLRNVVMNEFKARYVFATLDHTAMRRNMESVGFLLVYEDSEAAVYEVK